MSSRRRATWQRLSASPVASTLLYGTLLWLIFRFAHWARARLARWELENPRKLELVGWRVIDTGQAVLVARRVLLVTAWVIAIMLASPWLSFVLERFPYTRPWGEQLQGSLLDWRKTPRSPPSPRCRDC